MEIHFFVNYMNFIDYDGTKEQGKRVGGKWVEDFVIKH
jgi:hypothetical protein